MITFDTTELRAELPRIFVALKDAARAALKDAAWEAHRSVRASTLFKDHTGNLRKTLKIDEPAEFTIRVRTGTKYAAHVEEGTPPHMIAARRARSLAFMWHGHRVFRRFVQHPGTRARPFMANAARDGGQALHITLNEAAEAATK
jgi:hypothetical protein